MKKDDAIQFRSSRKSAAIVADILVNEVMNDRSGPLYELGRNLGKASKSKWAKCGTVNTKINRLSLERGSQYLSLCFHPDLETQVKAKLKQLEIDAIREIIFQAQTSLAGRKARQWSTQETKRIIKLDGIAASYSYRLKNRIKEADRKLAAPLIRIPFSIINPTN